MTDSNENIVASQNNSAKDNAKLFARGEADATIDSKGRIIVPSLLKNFFEDGGYLTRSLHNKALVFYPESYWNRIEYWLAHQSFTDKTAHAISLAFSRGVKVKLDAQNRISIISSLREYAQLTKEIVVIGLGSTVEIWDKDSLNACTSADDVVLPESLNSIMTTAQDSPAPGFL